MPYQLPKTIQSNLRRLSPPPKPLQVASTIPSPNTLQFAGTSDLLANMFQRRASFDCTVVPVQAYQAKRSVIKKPVHCKPESCVARADANSTFVVTSKSFPLISKIEAAPKHDPYLLRGKRPRKDSFYD